MVVDLRVGANVFDHDHAKPPVGNPLAGGLGVLGGDGGESNSPSKRRQARMYYKLVRRLVDDRTVHRRTIRPLAADLRRPLAASRTQHPGYIAHAVAVGAGDRGVVT